MKAPIAQAGGGAALPPGCASFFFLGPQNLKMNFKELGFRLGPDLVMRSLFGRLARAMTENLIFKFPNQMYSSESHEGKILKWP
jgi:hypothetical protein